MARNGDNRRGGDTGTHIITKTRPKTKRPSLYKVLLLNDDYTPMDFVVYILERFFNKAPEEATRIMLHVHQKGVGICEVRNMPRRPTTPTSPKCPSSARCMSAWPRMPISRSRSPSRRRSPNAAPNSTFPPKRPGVSPRVFFCRFPVSNSHYVMEGGASRFAAACTMQLEWIRMRWDLRLLTLANDERDAT